MKRKRCGSCKKMLPISDFYVWKGKRQGSCKACCALEHSRTRKLFSFKDRLHSYGPSPKDFEATRIAHEKLMAEIRATEGD